MLLSEDVSGEYVRKRGQKKVNRLLPKHLGKFASLFGHLFRFVFFFFCIQLLHYRLDDEDAGFSRCAACFPPRAATPPLPPGER